MRVLAVTSWDTPCGIAEYARQLKDALEVINEDTPVRLFPYAQALDPEWVLRQVAGPVPPCDLVWLNHHAALHSRWTPEYIRQLQRMGIPVVATLHDTYAGGEIQPNSPQLRGIWDQANATIVHEPVTDLPGAHLIRQGVPAAAQHPLDYAREEAGWLTGAASRTRAFKAFPQQPVLGTIGFNFPWKNYDRLCKVTRGAGWALVLLSNNATKADEECWRTLNPNTLVVREFLSTRSAVSYLTGCDATAFCYECANTGTSGAIRMGIAARKPVLAFKGCRQFRDLQIAELEVQSHVICWVPDWGRLEWHLRHMVITRIDPATVWLAHRDSWTNQARRYQAIFESTLQGFKQHFPSSSVARS